MSLEIDRVFCLVWVYLRAEVWEGRTPEALEVFLLQFEADRASSIALTQI